MYFILTSSDENQNLLVIHPSINPTHATRSKAYLWDTYITEVSGLHIHTSLLQRPNMYACL